MIDSLPKVDVSSDNPIDVIEAIADAAEWQADRSGNNELIVEAVGQWCNYTMYFIWNTEAGALYCTSVLDIRVPDDHRANIIELTSLVNEQLWLGHFGLNSEFGLPMFRYTILNRGAREIETEMLEDIFDIAFQECERFYPAFQFVIWGNQKPGDALAMAVTETVGEA